MKLKYILIFCFFSSSIYAKEPDLHFSDVSLTYSDTKFTFSASSDNSNGEITYAVVGDNNVIEKTGDNTFSIKSVGEAKIAIFLDKYWRWDSKKDTADVTISKGEITVQINDFSKTYGEDYTPDYISSLSIVTGSFREGEGFSTLNPPPAFQCEVDGSTKVGRYPIAVNEQSAKWNYNITFRKGDFIINHRDIHIGFKDASLNDVFRITYGEPSDDISTGYEFAEIRSDNENENILSIHELSSVVSGSLNVELDISQTDDCDIYKDRVSLSGLDVRNENYRINYIEPNLEITKRNTVIAVENAIVEYGAIEGYGGFKYSLVGMNWVKPEDATKEKFVNEPKIALSGVDNNSDAGTYDDVLSFKSAGIHLNYNFIDSISGDLEISKATLTVKSKDYKTNYKGSQPDLNEIIISGLKNNESVNDAGIGRGLTKISDNLYYTDRLNIFPTVNADVFSVPDQYKISITVVDDQLKNYDVSKEMADFTLEKATMNISIHDLFIFSDYGEPPFIATVEYSHHKDHFDAADISFDTNADLNAPDYDGISRGDYPIVYNENYKESAYYDISIDTGMLKVFSRDLIYNQPKDIQICRDATGRFQLDCHEYQADWQWYVIIPDSGTFRIDFEIADSMKISAFGKKELQVDSAQYYQEKYRFFCKLYTEFPIDPMRILELGYNIDSAVTDTVDFSILPTPEFTQIADKGESILICLDGTADGYAWGSGPKSEENIIQGYEEKFIYIPYPVTPKEEYWVRTTLTNIIDEDIIKCHTYSDQHTRIERKTVFDPDQFQISVKPNPCTSNSSPIIEITWTLDDKLNCDYVYNIFDITGEKIFNKSSTIKLTNTKLPLIISNIDQNGIYFVELILKPVGSPIGYRNTAILVYEN